MIGSLFYWTGAIVWACVGGALMWILIELVIGFCCAVSFFRWARSRAEPGREDAEQAHQGLLRLLD